MKETDKVVSRLKGIVDSVCDGRAFNYMDAQMEMPMFVDNNRRKTKCRFGTTKPKKNKDKEKKLKKISKNSKRRNKK